MLEISFVHSDMGWVTASVITPARVALAHYVSYKAEQRFWRRKWPGSPGVQRVLRRFEITDKPRDWGLAKAAVRPNWGHKILELNAHAME